MIYSYDLLKTPGPALARLCRAWTEEADDFEHLRRGLLYVIESLGNSLSEIAVEERAESIRADAELIWKIGDDARERWKDFLQREYVASDPASTRTTLPNLADKPEFKHGVYPSACDCNICEAEHRRVTGHATWCDMIHDGNRQCSCGAEPNDKKDS